VGVVANVLAKVMSAVCTKTAEGEWIVPILTAARFLPTPANFEISGSYCFLHATAALGDGRGACCRTCANYRDARLLGRDAA
jgi:hypothetical protein